VRGGGGMRGGILGGGGFRWEMGKDGGGWGERGREWEGRGGWGEKGIVMGETTLGREIGSLKRLLDLERGNELDQAMGPRLGERARLDWIGSGRWLKSREPRVR